MQDETRCQLHQTQQRISNERRQSAHRRREVEISLTPGDGMIPNLESAVALQLADNPIRR
jgi:transcription initiation factor TFIID subunit TAF12